ncbi:conserved hypothetical protein [Alkaliphilus metalliredigens QYMF]|uniref:Zinc-finger domain-containing protein n=1 Tax=Alkaliphilus metalliredigens (strain QYMF) TaxID=293826 RepID=A6TSB0_ALKMQ|nr:hypothetical protein [Alkaliphilus metalliredigens]ABR49078.1 conserved hypothetical protein [Alkaliphilus metalliredigens QYMF]
MNCSFDKSLLQESLENTIEPLESIILEEHLKVCHGCRRDLMELKLLLWELEEMSSVDLPPEALDVKARVLHDFKNRQPSSEDTHPFGIKDFVDIQSNILSSATLFLRFIPGAKVASKTSKSTIKKASSLLENFITGSFKIRSKSSLLRNGL